MQDSEWFEGIMVLPLLPSNVAFHLIREELLYFLNLFLAGTGILESGMKCPLLLPG